MATPVVFQIPRLILFCTIYKFDTPEYYLLKFYSKQDTTHDSMCLPDSKLNSANKKDNYVKSYISDVNNLSPVKDESGGSR